MLDIQFIRDHPDRVDQLLNRRGYEACASNLIELDANRRQAITLSQSLQAERNEASKKIGQAKAQGNEDEAKALMEKVASLKEGLQKAEQDEREHNEALNMALAIIPNLPLEDVPEGTSEDENILARKVGETHTTEESLQHFDIGEALGMMEFDLASKLSGARFVLLRSDLARLERALGSFMLDIHTQEFGYEEISAPMLVRDEALFGTGQLPKFKDDLFKTEAGLWLIPTAEVPLTNIVRERIIAAEDLPLRMTALTSCFRSEAGSAGRDTRGMIRLHQFPKVELVSIVDAESGLSELDRMTNCAEDVLKRLGLSYRVMLLCTGDMGFAARKTYDLEVWLPGQNSYREISSCSYCGDFQARRMNARYRHRDEKQTHFAHSLNGSALAVGRTLVALLENYIQSDGSVVIPDVLQPYMGGKKVIQGDLNE
jgi:seryl-tRNA synthetase